jgi:hypothetical protein
MEERRGKKKKKKLIMDRVGYQWTPKTGEMCRL